MEWRSVRKSALYLISVATLAFFFAASFGVMHTGMTTDSQGHMHDCPFMGMVIICEMSPLQHVSAWQNTFATLVLGQSGTSLVYGVLLALFLYAVFRSVPLPIREYIPILYISDTVLSTHSNALKQALSSGILHPKVF